MALNEGGKLVFMRGLVGFCIGFFTPIAAVFQEPARYNYWPSSVRIVGAAVSGCLGGMIALAYFMDGSFTRWNQNKPGPDPAPNDPTKGQAAS